MLLDLRPVGHPPEQATGRDMFLTISANSAVIRSDPSVTSVAGFSR
jgi:hypothetical protein